VIDGYVVAKTEGRLIDLYFGDGPAQGTGSVTHNS